MSTALALASALLAPLARTAAADGDPTICSGGSLAGRFSNATLVEGNDRGTLYVANGAQVRVVGTVQNTASGLFTGPSEWNLSPFTSGVTEKNTTQSVDTTWTNSGATGLINVRMFDNSNFSNSTRFSFTFTATGPQSSSCPGGNRLTSDEMLGGATSRSVKNASCSQGEATAFPVTTSTGNFWHTFDDLVIPGRGHPLALSRTYNAHPGASVPDGPFGFGWSFTYGMSLAISSSTVTLTEEAGSRITFFGSGPTYTAPSWVTASLVRDVPSSGMYTVTRQAQESLVFNSSGQLVSQRDLNGHTTTLSYVNGRLDKVTDPAGRGLTFAWVGSHIKTVTDANEPGKPPRVVTLSYGPGDAGADLTEVVDITGGRTTFAYDADHRMTRMRLPNQYDAAIAIDSDPEVVANVYDPSGRVTSQTDPLGRTTTFDYTTVPGSTIVTEPATSDPAGNPVTHVRRDAYSAGLLIGQTMGYGTAQAATWSREYDPATLGCTKITDPNNRQWTATYDPAGNRISVTDPLQRKTARTFTAKNLVAQIIDPRGNQLGGDPVLWTTTFTYDTAGCACNLVRRSRPLLNSAGTAVVATQVFEFRYGERGNQAGDLTTVVDPLLKEWKTDYDAYGYPMTVTDPLNHVTKATFDRWGRKLSETAPRGNSTTTPDPAFTSEFTYDPDNRLRTTSVPNPPGAPLTNAASYDANRNLVSSTDGTADTTTYEYDAANQARFVRRANGTSIETQYWADGSPRAQVDGSGAATRYFPDPHGRVTTMMDPLNRATVYGYDMAGNLTTKQDPGGNCNATPKSSCTTFGYDVANQMTSTTYSDSTTPDVTDIDYAANGARTAMAEVTKDSPAVTSVSTWSWDSLDRLVSSTDTSGATVRYGYDLRDALESITYPGSTGNVTRGYDDAGRWTSVTDWLGNTTSFGYDADDNLTSGTRPPASGLTETFGYDNPGQLRSIAVQKGAAALASFEYQRNGDGLVTNALATGAVAENRSYAYNALNQLCWEGPAAGTCAAPPAGATSYGYDTSDNLARFGSLTQAFDAANQLCWVAPAPATGACASPAAGARVLAYDSRGNRTSEGSQFQPGTTYAYDQANRLTTVRPENLSHGSLSAGRNHTLAVKSDGTVWAWGANFDGLLGNGSTTNSTSPVQARGLSGVKAVAAASSHSVALKADGSVWTWGYNGNHELGDGSITNSSVPIRAKGLSDVRAVAVGSAHSLALKADGTVWTWGYGGQGALGNDSWNDNPVPAPVVGLSGVVSIAGGGHFSLAVKSDGTVWSWGLNKYGQLGNGTTTYSRVPIQVSELSSVKAIGAGSNHSMAVKSDGSVWTWGHNLTGQLGNNSTTNSKVPVQATGVSNMVAVDGGFYHSVALRSDGTVWAWGRNYYGEVGNGTTTQSLVPLQVSGLTNATAVTAGFEHTLAVSAGETAFAWGRNQYGQLGDGSTVDRTLPVQTAMSYAGLPDYDYRYNGHGLRMTKTAGGTTTAFTWSEAEGLPLLLSEGSGGSITRYVYGPGGLPLQRINSSGAVEYYHHDQLGSTRVLTDASGSVVASYTYGPYGRLEVATGSSDQPFGFAGEYADAETGFQYLRARYYDPATAQFLTRDPLEPVTGTPYAYANNSPLSFTDPSGESPLLAAAALVWVGVEAALTAWDAVGTAQTLLSKCASGPSKLAAMGLFAAGILAPGAGYGSLDDLSRSGGRLISGDLTRAGQKLEQHQGGLFPKVFGSAAEKSALGQHVLDDILTHPGTKEIAITSGHFKGGRRFIAPSGRGATFDASGEFQYFGEYRY